MHRRFLLVGLILFFLAGAAVAKKPPAPNVTIPGGTKDVKAVLFAQMTSLGYMLKTDKKDRVVYSREMRFEDFPTTAMLGNTYSDPPQQMVTFRMKPKDDKVEVTARMESYYRDTLGLTRVVDLTHDRKLHPEVQAILDNVNAAYVASLERRKATATEAKAETPEKRD